MEWRIEDQNCWICGSKDGLTDHHTLPKHWKPRHNIVVPICNKCHDKLNAEDLAGMLQFAYRLEQELGRQLGMWSGLRTGLANYMKAQELILTMFKKERKGDDESEAKT